MYGTEHLLVDQTKSSFTCLGHMFFLPPARNFRCYSVSINIAGNSFGDFPRYGSDSSSSSSSLFNDESAPFGLFIVR